MRLHHLSLTNFRNYARLELSLPARLSVFQGANAQGKTNLLEAIHLLATARSPRAAAERELINWLALESPLPYARLAGDSGEGRDAEKLELVLELSTNGLNAGPTVRKQVRINGVAKRGIDLVGHLRVVLFLPEDVGQYNLQAREGSLLLVSELVEYRCLLCHRLEKLAFFHLEAFARLGYEVAIRRKLIARLPGDFERHFFFLAIRTAEKSDNWHGIFSFNV